MQELQARVVTEDRRDDREPEVRRDRAGHVRADHVGGAQQGDADVGPAAGEPAHVALDLGDVLGVPGAGGAARLHVLGEHRGVAAARAVDRRRRLHDQVPQARRLLAGGEELHRPDDVELLHRVAATGGAGGRDHAHVDDGVDVLLGDDLRDDGVADVGADERDVADVTARRDDVDADDPVDGGVAGNGAREPAAEVSRDPGDQHHPAACAHAGPGLLAELAALDARLLQQLAVLLLGHTLAPLLDDRTHGKPFTVLFGRPGKTPGGPAQPIGRAARQQNPSGLLSQSVRAGARQPAL